MFEAAGSPTQALLQAPALRLTGRASTFKIFPEDFIGDDEYSVCYFHVTVNEQHVQSLLYQAYDRSFQKLTGQ